MEYFLLQPVFYFMYVVFCLKSSWIKITVFAKPKERPLGRYSRNLFLFFQNNSIQPNYPLHCAKHNNFKTSFVQKHLCAIKRFCSRKAYQITPQRLYTFMPAKSQLCLQKLDSVQMELSFTSVREALQQNKIILFLLHGIFLIHLLECGLFLVIIKVNLVMKYYKANNVL